MTRTIKDRHRCALLRGWPIHGVILACETCGKWWRGVEPGNPHYAHWKRAWIRQLWNKYWRHQCDGEWSWCDRCERREQRKGSEGRKATTPDAYNDDLYRLYDVAEPKTED